jgi:hypothetical protein
MHLNVFLQKIIYFIINYSILLFLYCLVKISNNNFFFFSFFFYKLVSVLLGPKNTLTPETSSLLKDKSNSRRFWSPILL